MLAFTHFSSATSTTALLLGAASFICFSQSQQQSNFSSRGRVRWGILGTGKWAHHIAKTLKLTPGHELQAVGSRSRESAATFCAELRVTTCYGTYEELVHDVDVDVVYVITPIALHFRHSLLALNAGKHVVCEKTFTLNAAEAVELVRVAREKHLFLMESMHGNAHVSSAMLQIHRLLRQNTIGEIRYVRAVRGVPIPYTNQSRQSTVFNKELGGGCLLDTGVYPMTFALSILGGRPASVRGTADFVDSGVDIANDVQLNYASGQVAVVHVSIQKWLGFTNQIFGTEGNILWDEIANTITLTRYGEAPVRMSPKIVYNFEIAEVGRCLQFGLTESPAMPLEETISKLRVLDDIRVQWFLTYPSDPTAMKSPSVWQYGIKGRPRGFTTEANQRLHFQLLDKVKHLHTSRNHYNFSGVCDLLQESLPVLGFEGIVEAAFLSWEKVQGGAFLASKSLVYSWTQGMNHFLGAWAFENIPQQAIDHLAVYCTSEMLHGGIARWGSALQHTTKETFWSTVNDDLKKLTHCGEFGHAMGHGVFMYSVYDSGGLHRDGFQACYFPQNYGSGYLNGPSQQIIDTATNMCKHAPGPTLGPLCAFGVFHSARSYLKGWFSYCAQICERLPYFEIECQFHCTHDWSNLNYEMYYAKTNYEVLRTL